MNVMKAFVRTNAETQDVQLATIPIPEAAGNEVLVKVQAFGVGIHDRYFIPDDAVFPYPIGTEAAGIIASTGSGTTHFKVDDCVILTSIMQAKGGCWAEYVAAPENALIALPAEMAFTEGAAIPIAGKTALECMRALDLSPGDTLFVAGASGAIGSLVIQLAASRSVRVIGSASQKNHEHMLSLGAEQAVDYSDPQWVDHVRQLMPDGVSAALAIQPGTAQASMDVVKDGGKVVTVSGDRAESRRHISVFQFQHHADTSVEDLVGAIAQERMRLVIEQVYPFEQALEALRKTETKHARGKSVVSLTHP